MSQYLYSTYLNYSNIYITISLYTNIRQTAYNHFVHQVQCYAYPHFNNSIALYDRYQQYCILNNRRSNLYQAVVLQILKLKLVNIVVHVGDQWIQLRENYMCL